MYYFKVLVLNAYIYIVHVLAIQPTIKVGKFSVEANHGIKLDITPTETFASPSLLVCVKHFHTREDACFTTYFEGTCIIYTTGCCPSNVQMVTDSLLIRRDLSGFIRNIEDCSYYKAHNEPSGVYQIYPEDIPNGISVYCDMDTDGGGWTVIQQRLDGAEDFYRTWDEYKLGFGNVSRDHWLGNQHIYHMTRMNSYILRIDMEAVSGETRSPVYYLFSVSDESDNYRLAVGEYCGNEVTDINYGLIHNNGAIFSTKDRDLTLGYSGRKCTEEGSGAWWYIKCTYVNLNGRWAPGPYGTAFDLMYWYPFKDYDGLAKSSMKIRRK